MSQDRTKLLPKIAGGCVIINDDIDSICVPRLLKFSDNVSDVAMAD